MTADCGTLVVTEPEDGNGDGPVGGLLPFDLTTEQALIGAGVAAVGIGAITQGRQRAREQGVGFAGRRARRRRRRF